MSSSPRKSSVSQRRSRKRRQKGSFGKWLWIFLFFALLVAFVWFICQYGLTWKQYRNKFLRFIGRAPIEQAVQQTSFTDAVFKETAALGVETSSVRFETRPNGYYVTVPLPRGGEITLKDAKEQLKERLKTDGGDFLSEEENPAGTYSLLRFASARDKREYTLKILFDNRSNIPKNPLLAVVIDDFGYYGGDLLESYIRRMPYGVTFAIIPDLPFSEHVMRRAADFKHETIIHMPMQAENPKEDAGKGAIKVGMDPAKIAERINKVCLELPLCVGLSNHMGSKATSDEPTMRALFSALKDRHLFFLDSRTTTKTVAAATAKSMSVPCTQKDLFIDSPDLSDNTFNLRLEDLRKLKDKQKTIVVIVHCKDKSYLNYTARFVDEAKKMGFDIVPVSDIIKANR
jgi:uncharacterized protein